MRGKSKIVCTQLSLMLSAMVLFNTGCLTAEVWDKSHEIPTYGRVMLTPVTAAADAAIITGYILAMAYGSGSGIPTGGLSASR